MDAWSLQGLLWCCMSEKVREAASGRAQMLLLVGPALQAELGGMGFLALYLAGGVLANLAAYAWNFTLRRRRRWTFQARSPAFPTLSWVRPETFSFDFGSWLKQAWTCQAWPALYPMTLAATTRYVIFV